MITALLSTKSIFNEKELQMLKRIFLALLLPGTIIQSYAQGPTLIQYGEWFEAAFVEWEPVQDAESYKVYYSGEGISNQQIDDQLIRSYGSYYRADILGLKEGDYTISVAAVISGEEQPSSSSGQISVLEQDRSGFAFSGGMIPGAYNTDGTLKNGAVVLYISENTKNTISLDVTGATANPCVGLQTILEGFKKGKDARPLCVRLIGQITDFDYMLNGDIVIENKNNSSGSITIEGVGEDAVADGWGIRIKNASNVEIRNIGSMNCDSGEGDNIGLQQNNDHVWVHNCDFFYGGAGGDSDQAKGDGALDCKKSTYVTFSYNHFWDSGKCNLLGLSEGTTEGLFITYHHNWYDHSDSRHPRVRFYSAHVYNNYYDGNSKYGIGSTLGSSVFAEGNYFRNCKYPMLTSMQGSDVYDESAGQNDYGDMPTFSSEDGGTIKAFNNYIEGAKRFVPYGDHAYPNSTIDFDAVVVSSRNQTVANSILSAYGSNNYNNFDVDESVMYSYSAQSPEDAKTTVVAMAGRMNGGDFDWTFDNAVDDALYSVNSNLKNELIAYTTNLVFIQGDGDVDPDTGGGGDDGGDGEINPGDETHNFTESGISSTYYNITGSLSSSKGTVTYAGLTLTQCLKIESSTNISFSNTSQGNLTLVFNDDFNGAIKIDGTSYHATNGELVLSIEPGNHVVTKDETANLYLISFQMNPLTSSESLNSMVSFYPNPVSSELNISSVEQVQNVEMYSLDGVLMQINMLEVGRFDLSQLVPGQYIVQVYFEESVEQYIILKQ